MHRLVTATLVLAAAALGAACGGSGGSGDSTAVAVSPTLQLSATSLTFTATAGGASPTPQTFMVRSANAGTLGTPTAAVSYASGSGWLSAALSGTSAPFTVTVAPALGTLAAGTYLASVSIAAQGATNTPVSVTVRLTVTAPLPPPTGSMAAASLTSQTAQAGHFVGDPPAVRVLDASAHPVAGTAVAFEVVSGGGTLGGAAATTDADGVARVASWALGASGAQRVRAVAPGLTGSPVTFDATIRTGAYEITLRFVNPPTVSQRLAFERARERIEQVVTGDLPDVPLNLSADRMVNCGGGSGLQETVDDLLILVVLRAIDGAGTVLGQAGPCLVRNGGGMPVLGLMELDIDDLDALEARGRLDAVVLHEMFHVLGFGIRWTSTLLSDEGGSDPVFTGANALDAFLNFNNGAFYTGTPIPVENTGSTGTRDSHWRETVFKGELMTGWLSGTSQPLSRTTVASLLDLGYQVDLARADPFNLATAALRLDAGLPGTALQAAIGTALDTGPPDTELGDDVLRIPPGTVDPDGTVRPAR